MEVSGYVFNINDVVVKLFMLVIYGIIAFIFMKARKNFSGGKIAQVSTLIVIMILLFAVSDLVYFLIPFIGQAFTVALSTIFRLIGLCVLAFGGVRLVTI